MKIPESCTPETIRRGLLLCFVMPYLWVWVVILTGICVGLFTAPYYVPSSWVTNNVSVISLISAGVNCIGILSVAINSIGVIAVGVNTAGGIALGMNASGIIAIGSSSAIGIIAIGGYHAYGFIAIGNYACGTYALAFKQGKAKHLISPTQQDPEAIKRFTKWFPNLKKLVAPSAS